MDANIGRRILGQFCIIEEIGRGATGTVYKARQEGSDRLVAVKILHRELMLQPEWVTRFKREAKILSRLVHQNTTRVVLYGELGRDEPPFCVMEFLDGPNLFLLVRREGPMATSRAAAILVQVCGALEEAHNAGVVHRDLKPTKIVLTTQDGVADQPKIFGFEQLRTRPAGSRGAGVLALTQQGMVRGTPEFMSPEQAQGLDLDPRTDIYSVGIVCYELVSGRLPFKAQTPLEYVGHHIKSPPIPLAERAPELAVPPEAWPVMARALEKDPNRRYQTAADFARALAGLVHAGRADGGGR
jgi:serine/threonine-protein kinase